jgi:enoyl-CoA hydratase/carnithine racemase
MIAAEKMARSIRVEVEDGVATILLDVPGEPVNTLSPALGAELSDALRALEKDGAARAVVIASGKRDGFVAGANIELFGALRSASDAEAMSRAAQKGFDELARFPKPVVAAIHGACLGGGLELALACDIRIAGEDSLLGLTEVNLAIIPGGGGTQRLPRLVGRGKALEMILTGMRIPAAEALRIGLVERVVPVAELPSAAMALARTIAEKAPVALRYAKEAVVGGLGLPLEDGIRLENDLATLLRTTEDRVEGAKAFVEKRKPRWIGR